MAFKKEIEVKFRLTDKPGMQKRLTEMGGVIASLRFQRDTRAKQPAESKVLQHVFPRIREEGGKSVLTIKVKPSDDGAFFERDEYETGVDDPETLLRGLAAMGFTDQRTLEKYRQTWHIDGHDAEVVIDSLPFGDYMEIEGSKEAIESLSRNLGLEETPRITDAYFIEYAKRCREDGIPEEKDVRFSLNGQA